MDRFSVLEEYLNTSFWFLPSVFVAAAIAIAFLFLSIDQQYISEPNGAIPGLFGGAAEAARGLLSTIAGSLITVISIAFSITIVALQQAATQYSPRVLRNFTRDRGNQIVLGMYVATFIYALLILRSVRTAVDGTAGFVPALSITFALFLTLICIGLLVYFINHVSTSLQVEYIISRIHDDLIGQIEVLYPGKIGMAVDDNRPDEDIFAELSQYRNAHSVSAKQAGFVRAISDSTLESVGEEEEIIAVFIMPRVGDFVFEGDPILMVSSKAPLRNRVNSVLEKVVTIDNQRSVEQDPLFAIRQLVDVALRALSPGINDPTTAEYCLYYLGDAMSRLADREFPASHRSLDNRITSVVANRPLWPDFIADSFGQIRIKAREDLHVTSILIEVLERVAGFLPKGNRWEPLLVQLQEIRQSIDRLPAPQTDIELLLAGIDRAELTLRKTST